MPYLTAEEARATLIQSGRYNDATAPTLVTLEGAISILEAIVNEWLSRKTLEKIEYVEVIQSNRDGVVRLQEKPLIKVVDVRQYLTQIPDGGDIDDPSHVIANWKVAHGIVFVPQCPYTSLQVTYVAGHDPLPVVVPTAMKSLLMKLDEVSEGNLWDVSGLYGSHRSVSSLSLPGGVSKSFSESKSTSTQGKGDGTILDRILSPLLGKYRRSLRFV